MKNNLTLGIVLAVALGAVGWIFSPSIFDLFIPKASEDTILSAPQAVSDSLSDFGAGLPYDTPELYVAPEYGLSFLYPDGYMLSEEEVGTAKRAHYRISLAEDTLENKAVLAGEALGREGPLAITFDIYQNNLDKQKLVDWLKKSSFSNFKLSDGTYDKTEIAGAPALLYSWSGLYEANSFIFEHQGNIVMATVTYLTPEDSIIGDFSFLLSSLELY